MIGKLFLLSVLLVGFASAQNIQEFLRRIKAERRSFDTENPCLVNGPLGLNFASNTRGCAWYYQCDIEGNIVREDRCAEGQRFDNENQKCAYAVNVKCDLDDRWVNLNCPATQGVNVIPHKYSCSKYTVCFDGIENDRDCPAGTHFSYYDSACVSPFLADCHLDRALCADAAASGIPAFVPSSRDCGAYYLCVGSTGVPLSCRSDLHFNPATEYCDDPAVVGCVPIIPDENPLIPEQVFADCTGTSGVAIPHPESCQFFFFCADNRSYLQSCGAGLFFDTLSRRCRLQADATCFQIDGEGEDSAETPPENGSEEVIPENGSDETAPESRLHMLARRLNKV